MFKSRERAWSPYVAGVAIGLLVIPAMVLADTVVDPSLGFSTLVNGLLAPVLPETLRTAPSATLMNDSGAWWQVTLLVSILFGALISASTTHSRHNAPSPIWAKVLGTPSLRMRAATGFAGGFLMLLGASLAGGGLMGHGLSGMAQLAADSTIVLAAMVAGGLTAGRLLRRL